MSDAPTVRSWSFFTPERVISGEGAVTALPEQLGLLGVSRVFVLSTRSLTQHVKEIEELVGDRHSGTFAGIRQHTPAGDVADAVDRARGCDAIVAFGGGSVVDAAKAVAHEIGKPPQITIPTTLSSGEFTPFAGVTDEQTRRKGGVFDVDILPRVVIHDPVLARHTPESLWLSTGMRAVDHALETLWASRPHPYSDVLAAEALRLLWTKLPQSRDPSDYAARTDCLLGAWFSISGIINVGTRLSHPIGHQVGSFWNVPHGVTSCIALPTVMRHLAPASVDAQQRIAAIFGVATPAEAADTLERFIAALGVPTRLRDTDAVRDEIPLVARAVRDELAHMGSEEGAVVQDLLEQMW
jgi:alcohol dehydrogenase class IV